MLHRFTILLLLFTVLPLACSSTSTFFSKPTEVTLSPEDAEQMEAYYAFKPPRLTPEVEAAYRLFRGQTVPNPTNESLKPGRLTVSVMLSDGSLHVSANEFAEPSGDIKQVFSESFDKSDMRIGFLTERNSNRAWFLLNEVACTYNLRLSLIPDNLVSEHPVYMREDRYSSGSRQTTISRHHSTKLPFYDPVISTQGGWYDDGSLRLDRFEVNLSKLDETMPGLKPIKERKPVVLSRTLFSKTEQVVLPPYPLVERFSLPPTLLPPGVALVVKIPSDNHRKVIRKTGMTISIASEDNPEPGAILLIVRNIPQTEQRAWDHPDPWPECEEDHLVGGRSFEETFGPTFMERIGLN